MYGIHSQALAWKSSYLSHGVNIKGTLPDTQELSLDVPHGSVLNLGRSCAACILNLCRTF